MVAKKSVAVQDATQLYGMGAIPFKDGVSFKVWAPFAKSVCVAGTFNGWSDSADPMIKDEAGYWNCISRNATVGQEYKYVIVAQDGTRLEKNDPYARSVNVKHIKEGNVDSNGRSVIAPHTVAWTNPDYQSPSWDDLVIYELHIGTFTKDEKRRRNMQGDLPPTSGTFQKAITKLSYLQDLGINAIQIMPPAQFSSDTSWGYNPAYIYAIEADFGGPDGFRAFVNEAHNHGMAVIMDVVYNHFGPDGIDLWRFDGWGEGDYGGIYFYNDSRSQTPWGNTRPDYGRSEVRDYIKNNAMRWLIDRGVDGLRFDATNYIRNVHGNNNDDMNDLPEGWGLMRWINDEIDATQPWKITIAEDMKSNEWLTKSTGEGGAGFNAQWDASFVNIVRNELHKIEDYDRDMDEIYFALNFKFNGDALQRVIYTESHDEDANGKQRLPEEISPASADSYHARKKSTLGAALMLAAPGIPMIFQGQEFNEDRYFSDQIPLDWSKVEKNAGILALYKDLIRLRRNFNANTGGLKGQHINIHHLNHGAKVVAFHRWNVGGPGDDVVVVANFSATVFESYRVGLPHGGLWTLRFNSDWPGYSEDFGTLNVFDTQGEEKGYDNMRYSGNVAIGPYSLLIYSQ